MSNELPMWTDIVSAFGTGVAALVALALAFYSVRVALSERHAQNERETVAQHAEKRRQADRVTCWMEADTNIYPVNRIFVDNASEQPIWDVEVVYELIPEGSLSIPVIAASERHPIDVDSQGVMRPAQVVEVSFRDNRGSRWRRKASPPGTLVEEQSLQEP